MSELKHHDLFYKIIIILILCNFVSFSILYSLYAPTFEGPDENFHYQYSKSLLYGDLKEEQYLRKAPLSYLINAGILHFVEPPNNVEIHENFLTFPENKNRFIHGLEEVFPYTGTAKAVHTLRGLTIAIGALTLIMVFKTSQLIFHNHKLLPLFTTSLIAFTPKFIWMNSVVNNDALVYLFGTISIYFLIKFVNNKLTKFSLLLGLFVGLAILSKSNAIVLFLIVLVTFFYLYSSKQTRINSTLKHFFVFFVCSIIGGGWYIIHRFVLTFDPNNFHPGSLFQILTAAHNVANAAEIDPTISIKRIFDFDLIQFRMIDMIWNNLGWHVITAPEILTNFAKISLIVSLAGLFLVFIKKISISNLKFEKNHLFVLFSSCGLMIIGFLIFVSRVGAGDVRYTFPVIVSFGILLSIGFYIYVNKKQLKILLIIPLILFSAINFELLKEMDREFDHGIFVILPSSIRYDATSEFQKGTNIQKAFDDNIKTVWHSDNIETSNLPQIITIDYRKSVIKNHLQIIAGNMWHPLNFEILGSNDGKTMTGLHSVTEEKEWKSQSNHEYPFTNETPYRYYKINVKSVHGSFVEFSEIQFSNKDLN